MKGDKFYYVDDVINRLNEHKRLFPYEGEFITKDFLCMLLEDLAPCTEEAKYEALAESAKIYFDHYLRAYLHAERHLTPLETGEIVHAEQDINKILNDLINQ